MFLVEKYKAKNINDFIFNKDILQQLIHIASYENIPHLMITGAPGAGKKTLVNKFLEYLYDESVNNLTIMKYQVNGSSAKKEIEIMRSNYHIIIEPTNTNHDKYILQEIIKQYAMHKSFDFFKTKRTFKTIVIYNIDNLSINSQSALRRTMELYARSCRFIMVCNNLSKIFDPLRSRCRIFCVPLPNKKDIYNVISYISVFENLKLTNDDKNNILDNCDNNLKKAMWILDCKRLNVNSIIDIDLIFNKVIKLIMTSYNKPNIVNIFDKKIRTIIYNILITNIKGSELIITLMDKLINFIDNDEINAKIIQYASEAEYKLIHGRRDITHIDYFIISVMKTFMDFNAKFNVENIV